MHLGKSEQGMVSASETGRDRALRHGLAYQKLFGAFSGLVIVVDDVVVERLVAKEFSRFTRSREQGIENFRLAGVAGILVVAGKEDFEGIAGLNLALKIDVIGINANEIVDDRTRNVVAQSRLVDALVESDALAVVLFVVACGRDAVCAAYIDSNVFALVRPGDHGLDAGV